MSPSYFDRNQNLQIHGDVTIVSGGRSTQDNDSFLQVSQRAQATRTNTRAIERGLELLCKNTAPSARYGSGHSFTGPQCHPGTRIAVQDHIFKWLDDPDGQIAMWMNGPVGIGKSAIAQTVSHLAAERGQLSSAFFFFRSDDTRNSAKHLVPTLAYEMTQQMPHTLDHVCPTIAANPLIFSSPLERQINDALLLPLRSSSKSCPRGQMLIIIDGLDECLDINTQQAIIRCFISSFLRVAAEITPHKILIVSRPESHIASTVSAEDISAHIKQLALDSWDTKHDIRIFLREKLDEIKHTHPLKHYLPDIWPDHHSLRLIRERSVGSFAYASVVIRHLASHSNNPERALQDLLSLRPNRAAAAFADLDALYRHILSSLDPEILFIVRKVLCLYVYSMEDKIATLAKGLFEEKYIIEIALIRLSSLIKICKNWVGQCIKFHHTSFEEFLLDKERSENLYVFSADIASAVATRLSNLWLQPIHDLGTYDWFSRMARSMDTTGTINDMNFHILAVLVATKTSASFCSVELDGSVTDSVTDFFEAIRNRSEDHLSSPHRALYTKAFAVICSWLRSQFNIFLQGASTLKDILDVILANDKQPSMLIFRALAMPTLRDDSFYTFCQVFPEFDLLEICSGIVERYLTLPSDTRIGYTYMEFREGAMLAYLYLSVLRTRTIPSLCQRLEQIVLAGRMALSHIQSRYVKPEDCLYHIFYETSQAAIESHEVSENFKEGKYTILEPGWGRLISRYTDEYIRQAHAEHNFAYISKDVEALYHP